MKKRKREARTKKRNLEKDEKERKRRAAYLMEAR
jgi:hypothetical protein